MITTKPERTANRSSWRFVDNLEEFTGSSMRGEAYNLGYAPYLSERDTWMSTYETEMYASARSRVVYIVWSFWTPLAYFIEGAGWYKVGQTFSQFSSRHRNGALRNVPDHRVALLGKRGDWTVRCYDCGTDRHFTERRAAESVLYPHGHVVQVPSFDCETTAYGLDDCKHWGKPGTDCSGPRVGSTPDGVVLCEGHFNQTGA